MIAPTVNLNGTTGESLLEDISNAIRAINDAYSAMNKCRPHGRDFQTASARDYTQAVFEHESRLETLTAIGMEYEDLAEKIYAQMPR